LVLPAPGASVRTRFGAWWAGRQPRERAMLGAGAALVLAALLWMLFVAPPLRVAREAPPQIARLEAELQRMQRLSGEITGLRGTTPVTQAQAGAALKAATDRLGDKAKLMLLGDRATLTLTGASPTAFQAWLVEARSGARARPLEVQLNRGTVGLSGTVTVGLPAAGSP
jgi:general secretion pathway protein M